jgi:hypothetical protein
MRFAAALVVGIALAAGSAVAQPGPEAAFIQAVQLVQRASAGDNRAVDAAVSAFEALSRAEPANPVPAAYLGSAKSMRAREAWMPWNKIKYAEEGLDQIDRALAMLAPEHDRRLMRGVPESLETKLVAASTFLKLPDDVFHRRAAGRRLLAEVLASPAYPSAPAGFRASVEALR